MRNLTTNYPAQATGLVRRINRQHKLLVCILSLFCLVQHSTSHAAVGALVQTIVSTNTYDDYGNLTINESSTIVNEPTGTKTYIKKSYNGYYYYDISQWRLGWIYCQAELNTMPNNSLLIANDLATVSVSTYVYETEGVKAGLVKTSSIGKAPTSTANSVGSGCIPPVIVSTVNYTYDNAGNVLTQKVSGADFSDRTTSSTYDASNRFVKTKTNELGQTETFTYDFEEPNLPARGLVTRHKDPNLLSTLWEYDELGRKKKETRPNNTFSVMTYANCDASCESNEKYKVTTTEYRSDGSPSAAADIVFYDQLDRALRTTTTSFDGKTLVAGKKVHNNLGQVVEAYANHILPLVSGDTISNYKSVIGYDVVGRPLQTIEPSTRTTKVSYPNSFTTITTVYPATNAATDWQKKTENKDGLGRLVEVIDNANNSLKYVYDVQGNLRKTIDAQNNVIQIEYNLISQKTKMIDPDLGTWTYNYNILGELLAENKLLADNTWQTSTMTYDKLGRMLTRTEADLTSTWTYDTAAKGIGKLASESSTNGFSRSYVYDDVGRPSESITGISLIWFKVTNTYDNAGRLEGLKYPTGVGYKNVYDANGYLTEVRDFNTQALYWKAIKRDAAGNVTEEKLGNGLTTRRTYKPKTGYIETILTGTITNTNFNAAVQNNSYNFDDFGNLKVRTEALNNVAEGFFYDKLNRLVKTTMGTTIKSVNYDALGRITYKSDVGYYSYGQNVTIPNPSYTANWTPYNTWVPIGMGNGLPIFVWGPVSRPSPTLTVLTATSCGGIHRVCAVGGDGAVNSKFTYDANGNMKSGNGRSYTWMSFDMPKTITQGSNIESFIYDANHERVSRTSTDGGGTTTTFYLNPRLDLGGTFETNIKPDNTVENVHHIYAGGQVIGSVITTTSASYATPNALWSTDLTTTPTTASPNATGLTLPAVDTNGLIAWDNTTGNGRLAFTTKPTTVGMNVIAVAQRSYVNDNVLFKADVTTTTNTGTGRYLLMEVYNGGSDAAASKTNRRHGVYFRGGSVYAYYSDGLIVNSTTGNLTQTTKVLGAVIDNTTYVAEVETTPLSSTLYVYPKGQTRANGYSHGLDMDWRSLNGTGTLTRRMRVFAYGNTTESVNVTYLDNVSESTFTPLGTRYFHTDHLGSISAVTNSAGAVIERLSYDAWGKRRAITGADANGIKGTTTKHGFTGHESLDTVGLVHMNGRVYDPLIGRFISADPNVFYPDDLQDYDRYAYVHNNPLSGIDPSGFKTYGMMEPYEILFDAINRYQANLDIAANIDQGHLGNINTGPINMSSVIGNNSGSSGVFLGTNNSSVAGMNYSPKGLLIDAGIIVGSGLVIGAVARPFMPFLRGKLGGVNTEGVLFRRANEFSGLKIPLRMRYVEQAATEGGISLKGVKIKIDRDPEKAAANFPYLASTSADGKIITLYPKSFSNTRTLVETLGHERQHVFQRRVYGKNIDNMDPAWESAAYDREGLFWDYYKLNKTGKLGGYE